MTSEIMKMSDQAIKVADKFLSEIVTPLVKPSLEELGELTRDQIRYWRFSNQVKILNKAEAKLNQLHLKPRKIPSKLLVPLLEDGSLEDDESMIDRWANLLFTAANPNSKENVNISFIEALNQLMPTEAVMLEKFYDYLIGELAKGRKWDDKEPIMLNTSTFYEMLGLEQQIFETSIDNLLRLNLLGLSGLLFGPPQGELFYSTSKNSKVQLTRFGYRFVTACRPE